MCGRISQPEASEIRRIFHPKTWKGVDYPAQYNISIGSDAYVIYNYEEFDRERRICERMKFGYNTPQGYKFNARAEGFHNKENRLNYSGPLGIHTNPAFSSSFAMRRCLIPVSSFIEGPEVEKLSKPYKVHLNCAEVFALAGVWDWDSKTGLTGFSIITCWTNEFIKEGIGHHRMPVILDQDFWQDWLHHDSNPHEMLTLLRPYHSDLMECMEINPAYKSAKFSEPY